MSFILDALRKSEGERRMEAAPDVMRVPLAVQHDRLPAWAVTLMIAMAVAIVVLSIVWWRGSQSFRLGTSQDPLATTGVQAPAVDLDESARPEQSGPAIRLDVPLERGPSPAAATPAAVAPLSPATLPEPEAAEVAAAEPVDAQPPIPADLPSIAQLIAEGVSIPTLDLQLHVNSGVRASRFVMINGNRYTEGDDLVEGPTVVAINADGAVLRYSGRQFLLSPD